MFKEAIAEAKSIKEMAIANAKAALEESFTPHLNTILSAKLQEMEDEDLEEDYDLTEDEFVNENEDEIDLEELLAEIENEETSLNEGEEEDEEIEDEDEADEEPINIADMTDEDLKKYIEDVIKEMSAEGGLDMDSDDEDEEIEVEDEEVDLAELLAEIDDYDDDSEDGDFYTDDDADELERLGVNDLADDEFEIEDELEEGVLDIFKGSATKFMEKNKADFDSAKQIQDPQARKEALEILVQKFGNEERRAGLSPSDVRNKINTFREKLGLPIAGGFASQSESVELQESKRTINALRKELNEINVLNAKLLYTNKIFKAKNLTESQKLQVLKSFDKVSTVKESKLVYETLQEGLVAKKPLLKENLGSASRSIASPVKKQIINENDQFARMQKLAFGENKY
jgi:hypothetical protein